MADTSFQRSLEDLQAFTPRHFQPMVDLLLADDQTLLTILCDTVDVAEADKLAKDLFVTFEAQRQSERLLTCTISREIKQCPRSNLVRRRRLPRFDVDSLSADSFSEPIRSARKL